MPIVNIRKIINSKDCPVHKKCPKPDGYCHYTIRAYLNDIAWYENEWKWAYKILRKYLGEDEISIIRSYLI